MATWQREVEALRGGAPAPEHAMLLRWFRRRPGRFDPPADADCDWIGLYPVDAVVGAHPAVVFPVGPGVGPGDIDQESLVLVRGVARPNRGVVVITSHGELEPLSRPRRPARGDPQLVGEL